MIKGKETWMNGELLEVNTKNKGRKDKVKERVTEEEDWNGQRGKKIKDNCERG